VGRKAKEEKARKEKENMVRVKAREKKEKVKERKERKESQKGLGAKAKMAEKTKEKVVENHQEPEVISRCKPTLQATVGGAGSGGIKGRTAGPGRAT